MAAEDAVRRRLAAHAGRTQVVDVTPFGEREAPPDAQDAAFVCDTDLSLLPRHELGAGLAWLRGLGGPVAVSCAVAPRLERATTLLPPGTWRALFAAGGLEVRDEVLEDAPPHEGPWAATWRAVDPFRCGGLALLHVLLTPASMRGAAETWPDAVRVLAGPQHVRLEAGRRVGFLIAGSQDFHTLASWVAWIRPSDVVVLLRDASFGAAADLTTTLRQACGGLGVPVISLGPDVARDLKGAGVEVLVSASESPANLAHQGNAAVLLVARQLGIATAHVQHGIWPRAECPPPIPSVADAVLAWSPEYAEVVRADGAVHVVGAPRFDRYADTARRSREAVFGAWAARFERHVIVATNLHWGAHAQRVDARGLLHRLAGRAPRTLFSWKPHPYEPAPTPDGLPGNVVVLPEAVMLAAGLEFADVLEAADAVVTTPSTVALEAALAGVPCFVVDTGNRNHHAHVRPVALEEVDAWLQAPAADPDRDAYASHYCAPDTRGVSLQLALEQLRVLAARPLPAGVAPTVHALYAALDALGSRHQHLQASLAEASRYVQSLTWTIGRKDEYIAALHRRVGEGRATRDE